MSERPILWWYASGEQKFGPYSEAQLRGLVQAGHVRHGDLIWHHGLDGWVPAHSIEGLLPAHSPLPPALPPQLPAETSDEPDAQPDAFFSHSHAQRSLAFACRSCCCRSARIPLQRRSHDSVRGE